MRGTAWLVLAVCGLSLSCVGRSAAPQVHGRIEVYVHWQEYPLADRDVTIVELDLVRTTDAAGIAASRITSLTILSWLDRDPPFVSTNCA